MNFNFDIIQDHQRIIFSPEGHAEHWPDTLSQTQIGVCVEKNGNQEPLNTPCMDNASFMGRSSTCWI